jgi:hypothetical protein
MSFAVVLCRDATNRGCTGTLEGVKKQIAVDGDGGAGNLKLLEP